jgi:hypothetical protein
MDKEKIQDFNMIIDSFLEEGGNENGEFTMWVKSLSWRDKNIVAALLNERYFDEIETRLEYYENDALAVIRRHQLH